MDILSRAFADSRSTALTLGATTVLVTHSYMLLVLPDEMQQKMIANHAILNLIAGGAVVWGGRLVG